MTFAAILQFAAAISFQYLVFTCTDLVITLCTTERITFYQAIIVTLGFYVSVAFNQVVFVAGYGVKLVTRYSF
jgi:hypothetical protein